MELRDWKVEYVLASSSGAPEGAQVHMTFARPEAAGGGAAAGPSGAGGDEADAGQGAGGPARARGDGTLSAVKPVERVTVTAEKFSLLLYELKVCDFSLRGNTSAQVCLCGHDRRYARQSRPLTALSIPLVQAAREIMQQMSAAQSHAG